MKFLQLKQQLEKWQESAHPVSPPVSLDPAPAKPPYRAIEKIIGGDVLWKPVDKIAAMLLAKAPWYFQPVLDSSSSSTPKTKPRKKNPMSQKSIVVSESKPPVGLYRDKTDSEMSQEMCEKFNHDAAITISKTKTLLEQTLDARAAMDSLANAWKTSWLDFMETADERLKEIRMTRVAIDLEFRQLLAALRDVRSFFLEKDHDTEVARLKEFASVCERLQALKQSGFLDTVADTILRLDANSAKPNP